MKVIRNNKEGVFRSGCKYSLNPASARLAAHNRSIAASPNKTTVRIICVSTHNFLGVITLRVIVIPGIFLLAYT